MFAHLFLSEAAVARLRFQSQGSETRSDVHERAFLLLLPVLGLS
ncbi:MULTISPECIES: hypothetical protein [unclassified Pseudomonas]